MLDIISKRQNVNPDNYSSINFNNGSDLSACINRETNKQPPTNVGHNFQRQNVNPNDFNKGNDLLTNVNRNGNESRGKRKEKKSYQDYYAEGEGEVFKPGTKFKSKLGDAEWMKFRGNIVRSIGTEVEEGSFHKEIQCDHCGNICFVYI